jgi:hypothetical protein
LKLSSTNQTSGAVASDAEDDQRQEDEPGSMVLSGGGYQLQR